MESIRRSITRLLAIVLLLTGSFTAGAQETTARVSGQVTDQQGAVVSGAEIELTSLKTGEKLKVMAGEDGSYSVTAIQPGVYDLSVRFQGFKEYGNKAVEFLV
ncbi:MAG TPA: carboxypeptidase-like regulatory domain-containing protein, partial [Blastocatellia bacterium]|nr:carboxypeptidase-like regulatory domain-containing protein [Blastocatellia bacterium]